MEAVIKDKQDVQNEQAPEDGDIKENTADEKADANKRVVVPEITNLPARAKALLGKNLSICDLDKMPSLTDFRDPETTEYVNRSIAENKDIVFSSVKMSTSQWSDPGEFGKWRFRFLWHGRGIDGRVMLLVINDAFPSFYIRAPDGLTDENFIRLVKTDISVLGLILACEPELVMKKRFEWHEKHLHAYARVSFVNVLNFQAAINHFKDTKKMMVAHTEIAKSRLYLQMVREYGVNPAGMNSFKFKSRGNPNTKQIVSDIDEIFVVSIKDIKPWQPDSSEKREAFWIPRLYNLNFDIETGSAVRGQALYAERDDTHSHVLSFTMRHNRKDQLRVSLTTSEFAKPKDGYIQFICGSELEMFILFANLVRRLRPAIISTYNGDNFDWCFIVTKLRKAGFVTQFFSAMDFLISDNTWQAKKGGGPAAIEERIVRSYMRDTFIKISAEEMKCPIFYPEQLSYLNIDIFTMCKRKWPSSKFSEKSLNAFLAKVGKAAKYDMPAWRQFDIYEEMLDVNAEKRLPPDVVCEQTGKRKYFPIKYDVINTETTAIIAEASSNFEKFVEDITNVNVYCVFDTISALDLCDAAGLQTETFIVGEQYMCTPNEAIYLAKGGLVMEKVVYSAFHARDPDGTGGYITADNESRESGRGFPGAFVIHPPTRGLTTITPRISERRISDPRWRHVTDNEAKIMITATNEYYADPITCKCQTDKCSLHPIKYPDPMTLPACSQLSSMLVTLFCAMMAEHKSVPVVDWDFESMYPTIMAEHNSSPENMIRTDEEFEELKAEGTELYYRRRDFDGKYAITRLVKAPKNSDGSTAGPLARGIIPAEQHILKLKRSAKRKELGVMKKTLKSLQSSNPGRSFPIEEAICDRLNAEQLECKVAMNTMYGKMGDPTNRFFRIAISSDVTMTGREYLEEVIRFLESIGWNNIRYGDTDSIYAEPPSHLFDDLHRLFFIEQITRKEYAYQMTERAIALGKDMSKKINAHLKIHGTGAQHKAGPSELMNMAFEAAHFPAIFIRQKRNVTRQHGENTDFKANFEPPSEEGETEEDRLKEKRDQYHITGIGWKKDKAASKLFIELSSEMIFRLLDINNMKSARDIARDVITEAYAKANAFQYPMNYFIQRATYKPEKHNVRVINFIERLRRDGRIPPHAYEKFEYVKVRRDDIEFNDVGCLAKTSAADYMELYSYAMEHKLPINFSEYMLGEVCNEIANYMCCDPRYLAGAIDKSILAMAAAEEQTLVLGSKYIEDLCNEAAGTLTTAVKKPVYTAVKTHAAAYMKRAIPGLAMLTKISDLKLLDHARKASGALNVYLKTIETNAAAAAGPIVEKLKDKFCPSVTADETPVPMSTIVQLYTKMASKTDSPKVLYLTQIDQKKASLLDELNTTCVKIDEFAAWHSEYTGKITSKIKAHLGLSKSIITSGDITNAANLLKSNFVDSIILPVGDLAKIPCDGIFDQCARLVDELVAIEKQSIAFDIFRDYLSARVSSFTGGGSILDRERVREDIAEATLGIHIDQSAFEMPISRGD